MSDERNKEEVTQIDEDIDDVEIAELANKEITKRDKEIARLNKELAKAKLTYIADDDDEAPEITEKDCLDVIYNKNTCDYDYLKAAVDLYDLETKKGKPHCMGKDADVVAEMFRQVIEACDGDKSRAPAVYQSRVKKDDPEVALAYKKYIESIQ